MARRTRPKPRRRPKREEIEVTVETLGAQGDGIARHGTKPIYIPGLLPGETARVEVLDKRGDGLAARLVELTGPSPDRIAAPCPRYDTCGGCALQHLAPDAYAAFKTGRAEAALARAGIPTGVLRPLAMVPDHARRRAVLAVKGRGGQVKIGFHARRSHAVADIDGCLLLRPEIETLLAPLRRVLGPLQDAGAGVGRVTVTVTDNGADVLIDAAGQPDLAGREALVAFAEAETLARLSWRSGDFVEPVAILKPPTLTFAGVPVTPPPGGFLQPSVEGEAALTAAVIEGVGDAATVVDLFSGIGTFALPLAADGRTVHACEGDAAAVGALKAAVDAAGWSRVTTEIRDLAPRPLMTDELSKFEALVFDPPRAGAREVAQRINEAAAAGKAPGRVVAVSCNPATFARDAHLLIEAGYVCDAVTPVDQFPHSGHLELVAAFHLA